jgi:hypothetical protein
MTVGLVVHSAGSKQRAARTMDTHCTAVRLTALPSALTASAVAPRGLGRVFPRYARSLPARMVRRDATVLNAEMARMQKPGNGRHASSRGKSSPGESELDPRFVRMWDALAVDRRFAKCIAEFRRAAQAGLPGRFGSTGLRVNGKIFAMAAPNERRHVPRATSL